MISCDIHDYVEIACMYKIPLKLVLKSDLVIHGTALDTIRNELGEECMKVKLDNDHLLIVLDSIHTMEATTKNRHFSLIKFL